MAIINNRSYPVFLLLTLLICLSTTNCTSDVKSPSQDLSEVERISIDSLELIVSPTTNQEISSPEFMDILPDGRLAVVDPDQFQVLIINSDGNIENSFGRRGKGPGEFVAPRVLAVRDTVINAIDMDMQRVIQFDLNGNFIKNYSLERETSFFGGVALGKEMEFYSVANGYNGKLVGHHDASTDSSDYFGEAPVENPPPVNDRQSFRSSAIDGEVPEAIRNDLSMEYNNGNLYVFLKNLSRLQKYTNGNLAWDKELWLPVNDIIFDNFAEDASQSGFGVLRYIIDLKTTDDSIFLLWNDTSEHPQTLVQIDTEGEVQSIYELPKYGEHQSFTNMAVDSDNNRLYLCDSQAAEIYSVELDRL